MKKIEIEVPEGKKAEWVNGVLTLVDDKPANVMERIKTFEDAYNELGIDHPLVITFLAFEQNVKAYMGAEYLKDVTAYLKLRIIAAALNEGWTPKFTENECRWYPWFVIKNGGVAFANADCAMAHTYAHVGSHLKFKSKELAEYAGKQFIDIWKDYLINYEEED